jgi:hypothetical protein
MAKTKKRNDFYEGIKAGLEEAIAWTHWSERRDARTVVHPSQTSQNCRKITPNTPPPGLKRQKSRKIRENRT